MKDLLYHMIHTQDAAIPALLGTETLDFSSLFKQKELLVNVQITLNMPGVISLWSRKKSRINPRLQKHIIHLAISEQKAGNPRLHYVIIHLGREIKNPYKSTYGTFFSDDFSPWWFPMAFVVRWCQGQRCRAWSVGLLGPTKNLEGRNVLGWQTFKRRLGFIGGWKNIKKDGIYTQIYDFWWWYMMTFGMRKSGFSKDFLVGNLCKTFVCNCYCEVVH